MAREKKTALKAKSIQLAKWMLKMLISAAATALFKVIFEQIIK